MKDKLVISASRRTDLPVGYPNWFANKLNTDPRFAPSELHTIVIWTKDPTNIIKHDYLRETLEKYSQVYLQLTVTGIPDVENGRMLEPRTKKSEDIARAL